MNLYKLKIIPATRRFLILIESDNAAYTTAPIPITNPDKVTCQLTVLADTPK